MLTEHLDSAAADRLARLVRRHLKFLKGEDALAADDNLGQLGLDSMASIELLFEIEDHFGVQVPEELLAEDTFQSLNTLSELLSKALKR
jgi:acyl carrier protein